MRTALITPCYLNGFDGFGNPRLARNIKYIQYYLSIQEHLGFEKIFFIDNASDPENVAALEMVGKDQIEVIRFDQHLKRGGIYDYAYCWRALYEIGPLIDRGYEKIVTLDTDAFILSQRLADLVKHSNTGWWSVWCNKYEFPEASFHVLCEDSFIILKTYMEIPWRERNGVMMETALPFTHILKGLNCDRFGEDDTPQDSTMDFYGQAKNHMNLRFNVG